MNPPIGSPQPAGEPAQYYMIGGFLGAGKTTAVAALAQRLVGRGRRVGLITNDQGSELVDTAMLRARGFATEEIAGGCFCCRFNSLVDAARRLDAATRPDAFVAEPVGSCTDLVATVTYPLRRIYGDRFRVAPLSVLVDPVRAEQVLGLAAARRFSDKVLYIWRKQAEEADLLVITKADLLDEPRLDRLRSALAAAFPGKEILAVSVWLVREGRRAWYVVAPMVAVMGVTLTAVALQALQGVRTLAAKGLAFEPGTGRLYSTEHGPRGGDELNLVERGRNYGWPVITYGMEYSGDAITQITSQEGMEQPLTYWVPSLAVCGITFYEGDLFPRWKGQLFLATLAAQELRRIELRDGKVVAQEVVFKELGRIRHVVPGPDGALYALLPERIARIAPAATVAAP